MKQQIRMRDCSMSNPLPGDLECIVLKIEELQKNILHSNIQTNKVMGKDIAIIKTGEAICGIDIEIKNNPGNKNLTKIRKLLNDVMLGCINES